MTEHFIEVDPIGNILYSVNLESAPHEYNPNWIATDTEIDCFMHWYDHSTQTLMDKGLNPSTINKLTAAVDVADDIVISNMPSGSDLIVNEVVVASDITTGHIELTFEQAGNYVVRIISEVQYFEEQWEVVVGEAS